MSGELCADVPRAGRAVPAVLEERAPAIGAPALEGGAAAVASGWALAGHTGLTGTHPNFAAAVRAMTAETAAATLAGRTTVVSKTYELLAGAPVRAKGTVSATVEHRDERCALEIADGEGARGVAYVQVGGKSLVLSGGMDWTVRVRDSSVVPGPVRELTGHSRMVSAVVSAGRGAGCADGDVLAASCSWDGTVRLWGCDKKAEKKELCCLHALESSDGGRLVCLDVTPGAGRVVAGGSTSGSINVWTRRSAAGTDAYAAIALSGHTGPVDAVQVSQSGERIVSASWDKTVRIWRVAMDAHAADGPPQKVIFRDGDASPHVSSLALAADGKTVYAGSWDDSGIAVVDCKSAREVATLRSDKVGSGVRCLALLESSGAGDSASGRLFAGHWNGMISEWDLESRSCSTVYGEPCGHGVECIAARFTEQGSGSGVAVSCAEAARVGARVRGDRAASGESRNGDRAACGAAQQEVEFAARYENRVVRVWRASSSCAHADNSGLLSGTARWTADAAPARATSGQLQEAGDGVQPAAAESVPALEKHVAASGASGRNAALKKSAAGGTAGAAPAGAKSGEFHKAGDRVQPATAASALAPESYDSAAGARVLAEDTAPEAVDTIDATALGRSSVEPENERHSFELHGDGAGVAAVAYGEVEDESLSFTRVDNGSVRLLDARVPGKAVRELTGHGDYVGAVVSVGRGVGFAGGQIIAASCSEDGTARLSGCDNGEASCEIRRLHTSESSSGVPLHFLDVTPDAERIVAGGTDEHRVYVWTRRRSSGTAAATLAADAYEAITLPLHNDVVSAVQVSRTGERIVCASDDGSVRIWCVAIGVTAARDVDSPREVVFVARDKSSSVPSLALSADAQTVCAGMWDHSEIALVDCESAREVASLRSDRVEGGVRCLNLLDSCVGGGRSAGRRLFAGHESGVISEWDLESRKCLTLYSDCQIGAEEVWSITARFTDQGSDAGDASACGTGRNDGPRVTEADSGTVNGRDGIHVVSGAWKSVVEFAARYAGGMVRMWRSCLIRKSVENSAALFGSDSATFEVSASVEECQLESLSSCEMRQNANEGGKLSGAFDFGVVHEIVDDYAGNAKVGSGGSLAGWSCGDASSGGTPVPLETKVLALPKSFRDLTTGRGGFNIRDLQERSGGHNQVAHELPGSRSSPTGPVTLSGSRTGNYAIKNIILDMLTEFQSVCPTARHGPILALRGSGEGFPKSMDMVRERPAFWFAVDHVKTLAKEPELRWACGKFFEWWRFGFFDDRVPSRMPWHFSWADSRRVRFESARPPDGCSASAATAERNSSECGPPPILLLDDGDAIQPRGSVGSDSGSQESSTSDDQNNNAGQDDLEESGVGSGKTDREEEARKARRREQSKISKRGQRAKLKNNPEKHDAFKKKDRQRQKVRRAKKARLGMPANPNNDKSSGNRPKKPPNPRPQVVLSQPGAYSQGRDACRDHELEQPTPDPAGRSPPLPGAVPSLEEGVGSQFQSSDVSFVPELDQSNETIELEGPPWRLASASVQTSERQRIEELEHENRQLRRENDRLRNVQVENEQLREENKRKDHFLCTLFRTLANVMKGTEFGKLLSVPFAHEDLERPSATSYTPTFNGMAGGTRQDPPAQNNTAAEHPVPSQRTPATGRYAYESLPASAEPPSPSGYNPVPPANQHAAWGGASLGFERPGAWIQNENKGTGYNPSGSIAPASAFHIQARDPEYGAPVGRANAAPMLDRGFGRTADGRGLTSPQNRPPAAHQQPLSTRTPAPSQTAGEHGPPAPMPLSAAGSLPPSSFVNRWMNRVSNGSFGEPLLGPKNLGSPPDDDDDDDDTGDDDDDTGSTDHDSVCRSFHPF